VFYVLVKLDASCTANDRCQVTSSIVRSVHFRKSELGREPESTDSGDLLTCFGPMYELYFYSKLRLLSSLFLLPHVEHYPVGTDSYICESYQ
jgi:hypothetical protein